MIRVWQLRLAREMKVTTLKGIGLNRAM